MDYHCDFGVDWFGEFESTLIKMQAGLMTIQASQQQEYTLVVGLGITGLSVVRYLAGLGEHIVVVDSRDIPPSLSHLKNEFPNIKYHTGSFDQKLFSAARRIILSPGVSLSEPAVKAAKNNGIEICGDLDLFAHVVSAPVVAITGSNGKSTVTALLGEMAKHAGIDVAVGGNIGTPVLDLLSTSHQLYVLELSSFQLETLNNLPMLASVVLNISPDHLDRYESIAEYAMSKQTIYASTLHAVINLDDKVASQNVNNGGSNNSDVTAFTLGVPESGQFGVCHNESDGEQWLCFGDEKLLAVNALKIKGSHNVSNALAALSLGCCASIPMQDMLTVLTEFTGLAHRTQWVAEINGVNWFNDSKATNVGAAIAAIKGLPGKHVLIAGGDGKHADFSALRDVAKDHLRKVVLIGKDAGEIEAALAGDVICENAADMKEAVFIAAQAACHGDNVLLSPACASLDMYDNFEHRGDDFMSAVKELSS